MSSKIVFNKAVADQIAKDWVATEGVAQMQQVADACNADASLQDGYKISIEGDDPLVKHDFRATVITATEPAIRDNAKKNTLIKNFHIAGGT